MHRTRRRKKKPQPLVEAMSPFSGMMQLQRYLSGKLRRFIDVVLECKNCRVDEIILTDDRHFLLFAKNCRLHPASTGHMLVRKINRLLKGTRCSIG